MCNRSGWIVLLGTLAGASIAGCPLEPPTELVLGEQALPPGEYLIDGGADGLVYFDLADERGDASAWVDLTSFDGVYDGPGVYELSKQMEWSRVAEMTDARVDELLQIHDPLPAARLPDKPE